MLEYYLYYMPFINYFKLFLFSYILIEHNIHNSYTISLYDYIDNLLLRNIIIDNYKKLMEYKLDDYNIYFRQNINKLNHILLIFNIIFFFKRFF
jgi:hypothetical protein